MRCSLSSVPTGRARRRPSRSSKASGRRTGGDVEVLGSDPADPAPGWRDRVGRGGAVQRPRTQPHRSRDRRAVRRLLPGPARHRPSPRHDRFDRAGRYPQPSALRWPAAALRPGAGSGRGSRPALPGRADHRVRSCRPPGGVGHRGGAAGHRQDDLSHHPLHGGGRGAGRPDRRPGGRGDCRPRYSGGAGRAREAADDDLLCRFLYPIRYPGGRPRSTAGSEWGRRPKRAGGSGSTPPTPPPICPSCSDGRRPAGSGWTGWKSSGRPSSRSTST